MIQQCIFKIADSCFFEPLTNFIYSICHLFKHQFFSEVTRPEREIPQSATRLKNYLILAVFSFSFAPTHVCTFDNVFQYYVELCLIW